MAIKGHAKIELTDVHNGGKEVIESDNIVTNAIQDMLKTYGVYSPAILESYPCSNFNVATCYGGLITWDGMIEENKENYGFKPYGVNAGAHAAYNVVNSGTDELLGSYNRVESKITDTSAKFVYDFTTNQGNGVISCITLVSQNNGYCGFNGIKDTSSPSVASPSVADKFNNMIPFQTENKLISVDKLVGVTYTPSITIAEYDALLSNTFSLFKTTTPTKVQEITLGSVDLCDYNSAKLAEGGYLPIYYASDTKTISVVLYDGTSAVSEVTIATINLLTREVAKRKVSIPSYEYSSIVAVHYKNYLIYGVNEDSMSIMDLTTGEVNANTISMANSNATYRKQIHPLNEYEFLFWHDYYYIGAYPRWLINLKDGTVKELGNGKYAYPSAKFSFLPGNPLYFGTINNLETPVTKTADKTMKITYTLTEA